MLIYGSGFIFSLVPVIQLYICIVTHCFDYRRTAVITRAGSETSYIFGS